jgi:hypothetical protein
MAATAPKRKTVPAKRPAAAKRPTAAKKQQAAPYGKQVQILTIAFAFMALIFLEMAYLNY